MEKSSSYHENNIENTFGLFCVRLLHPLFMLAQGTAEIRKVCLIYWAVAIAPQWKFSSNRGRTVDAGRTGLYLDSSAQNNVSLSQTERNTTNLPSFYKLAVSFNTFIAKMK